METIREKLNISEKSWKIFEVIAYCLIAFLIAYLIITYVGQRTVVDGNSMYPALEDGDNIIVEKLSYRFGDIERYDVIVFNYHDPFKNDDVYYIKRVIGLPGETIMIKDGLVYLVDKEGNEVLLNEDYGYYFDGNKMQSYLSAIPIKIPENEYFVLGDNRNDSYDSRQIGTIHKKDILGRAWVRFYPFNKIGFVAHRKD